MMVKYREIEVSTSPAEPAGSSSQDDPPFTPGKHPSEQLSVMALPDIAVVELPPVAEFTGQRKLTVQLRRLPGREPEVLFGLEQIEQPRSELEQQAIFDQMTAQLVNQHQHFINVILPRLPRTLTTGASPRINLETGEKTDAPLQEYAAVKLIKQKRTDGRTEYKLISSSGRFSQYGIAGSREVLIESGLWQLWMDYQREPKKELMAIPLPDGITMYVDERGKYPVLVRVTGTSKRPF